MTSSVMVQSLSTVQQSPSDLPPTNCAIDENEIIREYRGIDIGMADSFIAGLVRDNDGILLTKNRKHIEPIDGLKLV